MAPQDDSAAPPPRAWLAVLLLALGLRAAVALGLLDGMPMVSDARAYAEQGLLLLRGEAQQPFYWPPGTPLSLALAYALLGPSVLSARLLLLVLGAAWVALVMALARRLHVRAAVPAGLLAALYGPAVLLAGQSYSQHLAALCLAGLALFGLRAVEGWGPPREEAHGTRRQDGSCPGSGLGRPGAFVGAGLTFGLGCITRPSMLSLLPVLGAFALFGLRGRLRGRRLVFGATLFLAAAALPTVPVLRHNQAHGAGPVLSTNNERNFFLGNNPYTPDYKTSHLGQRSLDELPADARDYLLGFYRRPDSRSAMRAEAQRYIIAHPGRTLLRTWNRALSFWGFDYLAARNIQRHYGLGRGALLGLLALEAGGYLLVMVLCLLGLTCLGPRLRRGVTLWLCALALGYQFPYLVAFSGGTYHFPVMGLLIPISGVALAALLRPGGAAELWGTLRRRPFAWAALGALLLIQAQYAYHALALES